MCPVPELHIPARLRVSRWRLSEGVPEVSCRQGPPTHTSERIRGGCDKDGSVLQGRGDRDSRRSDPGRVQVQLQHVLQLLVLGVLLQVLATRGCERHLHCCLPPLQALQVEGALFVPTKSIRVHGHDHHHHDHDHHDREHHRVSCTATHLGR